MRRHLTSGVLVSLWLITSGGASSQPAEDVRVLVGVQRPDGVIIPFAELPRGSDSWNNGGLSLWSVSEGTDAGGPPWFENGLPVPRTWLAESSGTVRMLRPGKPQVVDTHCELTWGLPALALAAMSDPPTWPRNAGIAVAGATRLGGFVRLASDSPEAVRLLDQLRDRFVGDEAAAMAALLDRPRRSAESRSQPPVTIESCLRSRQPVVGRWVYRVRLTRQYPPHQAALDRTCHDFTTFEAWVFTDAAHPPDVFATGDVPDAPTLTLDDCDLKTTERIVPLGVFDARGRTYVVAASHGYESEGYVLLEALATGPLRRLVTARGGGC